jgi:1,2-diacylglycerol 3-alpha-glucosyltransferase
MRKLCVQWPRLGPYHLARLRAAYTYLNPQGVEVVALETAGRDALYAWEIQTAPEPFSREQVFPERVFEAIPPAEVEAGIAAALDRISPEAVAINSYSLPDARAALRWCRLNHRVAVLMTDSKEDDAPRVWWRERVKRLLVSQYDAAFVGGTPQRRYLEKLGLPAEVVFTGANAVDNAYFDEVANRLQSGGHSPPDLPGLHSTTPYFLAVNRLLPLKNLDRLLLAYARYRTSTSNPWRLLLVGDGPDRARLEKLVGEEEIAGVTFCGFHQRDALAVYYALAGAFVHPTLKDTWGLVVNEAMAAGLPVLVSERAGCAEDLVEEGLNGFTFDPERPERLTELMALLTAPGTNLDAMGRHARIVSDRFSPERFAYQLWNAVQAGKARADRSLHPTAQALLWTIRTLARRSDSFHSTPETLLSS